MVAAKSGLGRKTSAEALGDKVAQSKRLRPGMNKPQKHKSSASLGLARKASAKRNGSTGPAGIKTRPPHAHSARRAAASVSDDSFTGWALWAEEVMVCTFLRPLSAKWVRVIALLS
jgi:hypothetical protein